VTRVRKDQVCLFIVFVGAMLLLVGATPVVGPSSSAALDVEANTDTVNVEAVEADVVPPETVYSLDGTLGLDDWYVTDVVVTLTATDDISGVAGIQYSFEGSIWYEYTGPFTITYEGLTILFFNAVDVAGNTEQTKFVEIFIDKTSPTTNLNIGTPQYVDVDTFVSSNTQFTLTMSDSISGMQSTLYRIDGGEWTGYAPFYLFGEDGAHTIEYFSVDVAGNEELVHSLTLYLDNTGPVITASLKGEVGMNNWFITPVQVDISADDGTGSGVSTIYYVLDSGDPQTFDSAFTVSESGSHTIRYWCMDNLGNAASLASLEFQIVEKGQYEITYTGDILGIYSDPAYLEALLIDTATQLPVSGMTVFFSVGAQTASAVTDSDGYASTTVILDQQPGVYEVSAWVEENSETVVSSESIAFTIERETASAYYTGVTVLPVGADSITLRATVYEDEDGYWGDVTQISVTFRIYDESVSTSVPIATYGPFALLVTEIDGLGVFIIDVLNLPEGFYLVQVSLDDDSNGFYRGVATDPVSLVVYEPSGEFMTGAGWIRDGCGRKGHFVLLVKYTKGGELWGAVLYTFSEDGLHYVVAAVEITGFAVDGNHAFLEATCVICYSNRCGRHGGRLEGTYSLRIDVWINAEGHRRPRDVFQIQVFDENGQIWHEAGYDPYMSPRRGNHRFH
jgi:hypothetical protein